MTGVPLRRVETVIGDSRVFRNEAFRQLWFADVLGTTASNAIIYSLFILVVRDTNPFFGNLFAATYILPAALLITMTGSIVDRLPKGQIIIFVNILRAALAITLALWLEFLPAIYLIAIGFAVLAQVEGPAKSAAVRVVVNNESLARANSIKRIGGMLSQVAGVVLLPILFLMFDATALLVLICSVLFAGAAMIALQIEELSGRLVNVARVLEDSRERFRTAWMKLREERDTYVGLYFYVLTGVLSLIVTPLVPQFTDQVLGLSHELGVFIAAPGVIGVWAALRFDREVLARGPVGWLMAAAFAVLVAGTLLLAFVEPVSAVLPGAGGRTSLIVVSMLIAISFGFAFTFINITQNYLVNHRMPERMQGRIFTLQTVASAIAAIPPLLAAGALAELLGTTTVFLIAGLAAAAVGIFAVRASGLWRAMPSRGDMVGQQDGAGQQPPRL